MFVLFSFDYIIQYNFPTRKDSLNTYYIVNNETFYILPPVEHVKLV